MILNENLRHAPEDCTDPDCELHNPEVIETEAERLTMTAFFYAGALALIELMAGIEGEHDIEEVWEIALAELKDQHAIPYIPPRS